MIGQAAPQEIPNKIPLSVARLAPAKDKTGRQISVDDKTKHLGGELNLPKDIPENSFVFVLFDSSRGEREMTQFRVAKNSAGSIELDSDNIPQITAKMINDKIPAAPDKKRDPSAISAGDELNFNDIGDTVFCMSLHLPMGKNLTGGEVVVVTPKMFGNYRKAELG
jgi:hypothetical protein